MNWVLALMVVLESATPASANCTLEVHRMDIFVQALFQDLARVLLDRSMNHTFVLHSISLQIEWLENDDKLQEMVLRYNLKVFYIP